METMLGLILTFALASSQNPYLAQARELYRELEYERCVAKLNAAQRSEISVGDAAEVQLYQGLCKHGLGRGAEAENHFRLALSLNRKIAPPEWVSPSVSSFFEDVKKTVPAPAEDAPKNVVLTPAVDPPPPPPPQVEDKSRSRVAPLAFGAFALAATGTGVYFGVRAQSLEAQFQREEFEAPAAALSRQAKQSATAANISYAAGAAGAVAAGVAWWLLNTD